MNLKIAPFFYVFVVFVSLFACKYSTPQRQANETSQAPPADTCDDPDASINCAFLNMPDTLSSIMTIAPPDEPGARLIISGTIFKADGKTPLPNVVMYAYHTDNKGFYSKKGNEQGVQKWHGNLHGWCRTNSSGYYEIRTIRPAPYPDNSMPAHIHTAVWQMPGQPVWINDFVFSDDSLVTGSYLASLMYTGGAGVVRLQKKAANVWEGQRNITLDKN